MTTRTCPMKQMLCYLFGHTGDGHDGRYHVCDRCGAHAYYSGLDGYEYLPAYYPHAMIYGLYWRLHDWITTHTPMRKEQHDDELPF